MTPINSFDDEKARQHVKEPSGQAKCGWCLTGRCDQCLPGGDNWTCNCDHGKANDDR